MSFHRNAKLGLAGGYALVSAIAGGMTPEPIPNLPRSQHAWAGRLGGW